MKKIASIILAAVMICAMLSMTVFAEDAPKEISPNSEGEILCNGNRIISQQGEVKAVTLHVNTDATLTIAEGTTVKVDGNWFNNNGTIIVYGTLDLSKPNNVGTNNSETGTIIVYGTLVNGDEYMGGTLLNCGKVIVVGCGGQVTGEEVGAFMEEPAEFVDHYYIDGFCACGAEDPAFTASVLSEGGLTIIVGVAGVAVGMAVMFLIMKKKKKTEDGICNS